MNAKGENRIETMEDYISGSDKNIKEAKVGNVVITDKRSKDKYLLKSLKHGCYFIWREEFLCRKLYTSDEVEISPIKVIDKHKILCVFVSTGEIALLHENTYVEPVNVDVVITD